MPPLVSGVEFVADPIDAESASWNLNLVKELFPPCEVVLILASPLSCRLHPDKLMWHYDLNGLFSVKSAYKVVFKRRFEASSSQLSLSGVPMWKALWKANVPSEG
ncbi:hypothetical protein ACFX13_035095 [Malus domestica]